MSNVQIEIQRIIFDTSDPEITTVTIEIDHNDQGILLKRQYTKSFSGSIPVVELLQHHMFSGENHYLLW